MLIGVLENVVGFYFSPAYKEGVALMLFLVVILFRPEGLLGKRRSARYEPILQRWPWGGSSCFACRRKIGRCPMLKMGLLVAGIAALAALAAFAKRSEVYL